MRIAPIAGLLTLATLVSAQSPAGFPGPTREVTDPYDRVAITVPERWVDRALGDNQIVHVQAPGSYGGHDLSVTLEEGYADRERQRARYLEYDAKQHAGATIRQFDAPWYGYRLLDETENRALVRCFLVSGDDGLVLTVISRHTKYDELYADLIEAIAGSARAGEARLPDPAEQAVPARGVARVYDAQGAVSFLLPSGWTQEETLLPDERIQIRESGISSAPRILLKDWGGPTSPDLVLVKISSQWVRAYGALEMERLDDPPRLLVKGRAPGSIDYLTAIPHGDQGFVLQLTAKADVFDRFRPVADEVARSVHFADAAWHEPQAPAAVVTKSYRKLARVEGEAECGPAVDAVLEALPAWEQAWSELKLGDPGKAGPLLVHVVREASFAALARGFGGPPAAYDPIRCLVVATGPAPGEDKAWRAALFSALAEAELHRDLRAVPPPWLRVGVAAIAEAAGLTGEGPETPHPALLAELLGQIPPGGEPPAFETLEHASPADLRDVPGLRARAWGYAHLMLFGRGTLASHFKRWSRALEKADGEAPPFDRKGYAKSSGDLARHLEKLEGR